MLKFYLKLGIINCDIIQKNINVFFFFFDLSSKDRIYIWPRLEQSFCITTVDCLSMNLNNHIIEPWHEISNNVVCATCKASDQPARMHSLIRAFTKLQLLSFST